MSARNIRFERPDQEPAIQDSGYSKLIVGREIVNREWLTFIVRRLNDPAPWKMKNVAVFLSSHGQLDIDKSLDSPAARRTLRAPAPATMGITRARAALIPRAPLVDPGGKLSNAKLLKSFLERHPVLPILGFQETLLHGIALEQVSGLSLALIIRNPFNAAIRHHVQFIGTRVGVHESAIPRFLATGSAYS